MLAGPYSICHGTYPNPESDTLVLTTLSYGYKTAHEAYENLIKIALDANVPDSECIVIRLIELDEAPSFSG